MKHTRSLLVLTAVIVLISLGCSFSSGVDPDAPAGTVLFEDDFSNKSGGWDSVSATEGVTDYADGTYRITVNEVNYYLWSNPRDMEFTDVIIEVDATKSGGPDANDIGVICRYTDENNFYFFTFGSDGYYAINKLVDGEETLVGMDQFGFDDNAIQPGSATNHLRVACVGSTLSLSVNRTLLVEVTDTDLTEGNIGLIAGTWDDPGTDVLFDNFKVTKP